MQRQITPLHLGYSQCWRRNLILTGLQPGEQVRKQGEPFQRFSSSRHSKPYRLNKKPLKRFSSFSHLNTGLKPGVNKKGRLSSIKELALRCHTMPELPDIVVYVEALDQRILGQTLKSITVGSPFLLRTAEPPLASVHGLKVVTLRRLGKRICFGFENELWLVLHLMIAGRLHWKDATNEPTKKSAAAKLPNKRNLATFEFANGILSLTEAGTQRRAALHLLQGEEGLERLNPGGLEVLECELSQFASVLQSANHTLKRALTDPHLFSGIGNAYSDEILWHAQLSPIALTQKLRAEEIERLFNSTRAMLSEWVELLRADAHGKFPEKVTAFRPEMAVHGKYQEPCPRCGSKVRRIRYAANETNYCPGCQTGGKLLADRALSRLLRADWPRSEEELENRGIG